MKNIRIFLSENFHFFMVNFSVYLNRRVFVMKYSVQILSMTHMPYGAFCDFAAKIFCKCTTVARRPFASNNVPI